MPEIGQVVEIEGNKVVVKLKRTEACAKCRACTVGMQSQDMIIKAYNNCEAKIGDSVEIVLEEADFVTAVMISYGIPFLSLIIGTFLGFSISEILGFGYGELVGFAFGIIFVVIAYLWIKSKEEYWKSKNFVPKAVKKV